MRPLVIGTAGHIDHGKTSLVKALTGVDTDRLAEERRRGITIELGFTHLELPSGRSAGFVDVPGHERFVRTMIAGATGLDLVLLVIAADEGVMPQTREHLDIIDLLGVERGIVVLTKVDMVDGELLELARMDVADFVAGTFLEDAPVVPFSAVSGLGREALLEAIDREADRVKARRIDGPARLCIDRVFSQRGFGTVVTGTLASGQVKVGDTLEVLPAGVKLRVRGVQVHEAEVEVAVAGSRTALNLVGVERQGIDRGDVLATPGSVPVTSVLDLSLRVLPTATLPLGARRDEVTGEAVPASEAVRARLLTGTLEVLGRFQPLGRDVVLPGEEGFVQVRLEAPIPASAGDRVVVRAESPMVTLAGGVVVDPLARRHRRRDGASAAEGLARLLRGAPAERVGQALLLAGPAGRDVGELSRLCRLSPTEASAALDAAAGEVLALGDGRWVASAVGDALERELLERLDQFHAARPLAVGPSRAELKPGDWVPDRLLTVLLDRLRARGEVLPAGVALQRRGFCVRLSPGEERLAERLVHLHHTAGLTPPTLPEALEAAGGAAGVRSLDDLMLHLTTSGPLVRVKEGLYFHKEALAGLEASVRGLLLERGEMNPNDFKELTGLTRKYAIPLLEHLDKLQLTIRVGDVRRLRG